MYELFSSISPTKWVAGQTAGQLEFAYVCGLANGIFSETEGLANALGAIANYLCDQNFRAEVNTALSNLTFDQVVDKISEDFNGNIFEEAHMAGKYTIMILTVIVPITKINWAAKITSFSTKITQFSAKTVRFIDDIKLGVLAGWRTVNDKIAEVKKLVYKKSNGVDIPVINFGDEGQLIINPTYFGSVDETYYLVYDLGEVTYKVGDNGSEEIGNLVIYRKGDDVRVEVSGAGSVKIWSSLDEVFPVYFEGISTATLHKVILNDGSVVDVGYSLTRNNVLEFYINIPENLQNQGVFNAVYESIKTEYSYTKIKGWWKTSGNYSTGESTNLTIFKQKISEGLTPEAAALETPVGKVYKLDGFDKVEIITNSSEEVIVNFYK